MLKRYFILCLIAGVSPLFADTYNFTFKKDAKTETKIKVEEKAPEILEPVKATARESEIFQVPKRAISPYRFGFGGVFLSQKYLTAYGKDNSVGGVLSLGYAFNGVFGVNGYGGVYYTSVLSSAQFHFGADFEIYPFNSKVRELQRFELAGLLGMSSARAALGNLVSLHAGLRACFNLTPEFGFSAVGRGNLGYQMVEIGFTKRL